MALLNSLFSFPSDSYLLFHLLYIVRLKVSEHPTIADPGLLILVTGEIIKLQRIKTFYTIACFKLCGNGLETEPVRVRRTGVRCPA